MKVALLIGWKRSGKDDLTATEKANESLKRRAVFNALAPLAEPWAVVVCLWFLL